MGNAHKTFDDDAAKIHIAAYLAIEDPNAASDYFAAHLFEPLSSIVRIVASRLGGLADESQQKEFKQTAMLRILKQLPLYDPEKATPFSWAYSVAKNHGYNFTRDANRYNGRKVSTECFTPDYLSALLNEWRETAKDFTPQREFFLALWTDEKLRGEFEGKALRAANEVCAAIRDGGAYFQADIARAVGMSETTIHSVVGRLASGTRDAWEKAALN
jgi:DNA-directed RNA polymerase specialized sigma24 family protein